MQLLKEDSAPDNKMSSLLWPNTSPRYGESETKKFQRVLCFQTAAFLHDTSKTKIYSEFPSEKYYTGRRIVLSKAKTKQS